MNTPPVFLSHVTTRRRRVLVTWSLLVALLATGQPYVTVPALAATPAAIDQWAGTSMPTAQVAAPQGSSGNYFFTTSAAEVAAYRQGLNTPGLPSIVRSFPSGASVYYYYTYAGAVPGTTTLQFVLADPSGYVQYTGNVYTLGTASGVLTGVWSGIADGTYQVSLYVDGGDSHQSTAPFTLGGGVGLTAFHAIAEGAYAVWAPGQPMPARAYSYPADAARICYAVGYAGAMALETPYEVVLTDGTGAVVGTQSAVFGAETGAEGGCLAPSEALSPGPYFLQLDVQGNLLAESDVSITASPCESCRCSTSIGGSPAGNGSDGPALQAGPFAKVAGTGAVGSACRLGVQSVQFGGDGVTDVVRDQPAPPGASPALVQSAQTIAQFNTGCGVLQAQWVNCDAAGPANKVWPIIVPEGHKLRIAKVVFKCTSACQLNGAKVVGKTNLGFEFEGSASQNAGRLTATNLVSGGALPSKVRALSLRINWSVAGKTAGTSTHPVYIVGGDGPLATAGPFARFVSLVQMTTEAAMSANASTPPEIFNAVWEKLRTLQLSRFDLDPTTGIVTAGNSLFYWWPDWSLQSQVAGKYTYPASCYTGGHGVQHLLSDAGSHGTCEDWALYMVYALASQGLASQTVNVGSEPGFENLVPDLASVMLIKGWDFEVAREGKYTTSDYPYQLMVTDQGRNILPGLVYAGTPSQGIDPTPKGQFGRGDHVIVKYAGKLYDPSYGLPNGEEGFTNITEWAHVALAGYGQEFVIDASGQIVHNANGLVRIGECGPAPGQLSVPPGGECVLIAHLGVGTGA